ncbi:unnamed protein product [Urochloa humidicola]
MAGEPSSTPAGAATEAEAERLLTLSESELSAGCIRAARKNARRGALLDPASRRAAALQLRRPLAPGDYSASPLSASALRRHFKSLAESLRVDASPAILDADGEEIEMGKPSLKKKRGSGGGGKSGEHGGKPASLDRSGSKVLDGRVRKSASSIHGSTGGGGQRGGHAVGSITSQGPQPPKIHGRAAAWYWSSIRGTCRPHTAAPALHVRPAPRAGGGGGGSKGGCGAVPRLPGGGSKGGDGGPRGLLAGNRRRGQGGVAQWEMAEGGLCGGGGRVHHAGGRGREDDCVAD